MTIPEFIEKAIEGGWEPSDYGNALYEVMQDFDKEMTDAEADGLFKKKGYDLATSYLKYAFKKGRENLMFLDPLAWQAVEKTQLKSRKESAAKWGFAYWENDTRIDAYAWFMHRMIDALAEGKSIEEFLATL